MDDRLEKLHREHTLGNLVELECSVEEFLINNAKEIVEYQSLWKEKDLNVDIITSAKLFILKRKSIDFKREMRRQASEIRRFAEESHMNIQKAFAKWSKKHAAEYRDDYVFTLTYILEAHRDKYTNLIEINSFK